MSDVKTKEQKTGISEEVAEKGVKLGGLKIAAASTKPKGKEDGHVPLQR